MSASVEVVCVEPARWPAVWPHVAPMLQAACDRCGDWTSEAIRAGLADESLLLWITWDGAKILAAAVTQLILVPRGLVCQIVACGGTDVNWPERLAHFERFARDEGCVEMRVQGRPGWARVLPEYKTEWVSLAKRLA
jgi:hypothetical protein